MKQINLKLRPMLLAAVAAASAGCSTMRIELPARIPEPHVSPLPVQLSVRIPDNFAKYLRKEQYNNAQWEFNLGPMQSDAFRRVALALFPSSSVEAVAPGAGPQPNLEAVIDNFVFLTATESSDFYSATIWYRANVYATDGSLVGSWPFQGYGSVTGQGRGHKEGVTLAAGLAIRDAFANFAANFPQQRLVQQLVTGLAPAPVMVATPNEKEPEVEGTEEKGGIAATPPLPL